jgi:hypothetical protein
MVCLSSLHELVAPDESRRRSKDGPDMRRSDKSSNKWVGERESFVERLADTSDAGFFRRWMLGVGLAAVFGACAFYCFWTGRAVVPAGSIRHAGQETKDVIFARVHGVGAVATGIIYLSIAAFIHLQWFWTSSPRFWGYAQLGKLIAIGVAVAAVVTLVFVITRGGAERFDPAGGRPAISF